MEISIVAVIFIGAMLWVGMMIGSSTESEKYELLVERLQNENNELKRYQNTRRV